MKFLPIMILYYVFETAVSDPIGCVSLCVKNITKNYNGKKCQGLMGRNFCAIMVRSKKKPAKAEETNFCCLVGVNYLAGQIKI